MQHYNLFIHFLRASTKRLNDIFPLTRSFSEIAGKQFKINKTSNGQGWLVLSVLLCMGCVRS